MFNVPVKAEEFKAKSNTPPQKRRTFGNRQAADAAVDAMRYEDGRPLDPLVRAHFENSLGFDFSRVRVHSDEHTSAAAIAINARAYTVGRHIAFAQGEYASHTEDGRGLIGHELIHTVQQAQRHLPQSGSVPITRRHDLAEVEARHAARPGMTPSVTPGQIGIARDDAQHHFVDFLRAERKRFTDDRLFEAMEQIGTPQYHKDEVLNYVDHASVEDLKRVVNVLSHRKLSDIAGSPQGAEVVQHLLNRLPPVSSEHGVVESVLEERGSGPTAIPVTKARPADAVAIDRINKAIDADPNKAEYSKAKVPLRFPVEIYTAGRAVDGGVYYDPNLTEAGRVPVDPLRVQMSIGKVEKTTRSQHPLLFIKLGPSVLGFTDTFIQETLWHEFRHYTRHIEFRAEPTDKSEETKLLEQEEEDAPLDSQSASHEVEATSVGIAAYGSRMNDDEFKSNLIYLSKFLQDAQPIFRNQAIDRISTSAGDAKYRKRILALIDHLHDRLQKRKLKFLRDALAGSSGK